ncbi:hypothetical protein AC578_10752 [Pseudocercospora eumusae]|uniref:Uncharacterized protein n=1 Tax=Pseudocercospora eumusae TaxID=321146 RepID=A0A139H4G4_9PEZI|nr:hypothetical protein AC578_10752 [Pseudocercospora eumusae]
MLLMAILPALLVFISTLLSYAYRSSKTMKLSAHDRKTITKAHAFAIETTQIFLLLCGILTIIRFCGILTEHRHEMSLVHIQVPFCFALVLTFSIYIAAIFAIDLLDNRIQLGTWQHPFQTQTLLLTRSKFMPWTIKTTPRHRHIRKRAFSSPAAFDMMMPIEVRHVARSLSVVDTGAEPTTNVIWSRSLSTTFSPTPDSVAQRPASEQTLAPRDINIVIAEEKEGSSAQVQRNEDVMKCRDEVGRAQAVKIENVSSAIAPKILTPPSTPPPRIL